MQSKKLIFLLFFLFATGLFAQSKKLSLFDIIQRLEVTYKITFSYADANIQGVNLDPPLDNYSLDQVLKYLNENTDLQFERLNENIITISPKSPEEQVFCGYLMDAISQNAVEGALVYSGIDNQVSDKQGYFQLKFTEGEGITVRSVAYELYRIEPEGNEEDCPVIHLEPFILELREVLISNYLTEGIDKRISGEISVEAEELGILPGLIEPDVLQTVQILPGIKSQNETISDINIRGGTNDQNLITWNGIKMYQTGHFFGLISVFNPYLVEEVDLIKNGTSASLGEAVSGTLAITTDNSVADQFTGSAGLNLLYGNMYGRIPISSAFSVEMSARRSVTDIISSPTYNAYFDRVFVNTEVGGSEVFDSDDRFYFYDYSVGVQYEPTERDKLSIHVLNVFNRVEYLESAVVNSEVITRSSGLDQESFVAGMNYRRKWKDDITTHLKVNLSEYNLRALNQDIPGNQTLQQGNEVRDYEVRLDLLYRINNRIDLHSGIQIRETGVSNQEQVNNPDFSRLIKEVLISSAIFAEANYHSANERLYVRGGVRLNRYDKLRTNRLEPRLVINYKFTDHLSVELLGETKSQITSQIIDLQDDFLGVEKRRWILAEGNDTPLTTGQQISKGINYNRSNWLFTLEGYYKKVEGILTSGQAFQNQFQFVRSVGGYDVYGIDLLLNVDISQRLKSWGSYSYAVNNYNFPSLFPPEFPHNLDFRHIFTLGADYQDDNLEVSAGVNWHSGQPYTQALGIDGPTSRSIIYDHPNALRIADYFRLDMSVKYSFLLGEDTKAQLGASVWNLTNHKNTINIFYQPGEENGLREVRENALKLTPNLSYRIYF